MNSENIKIISSKIDRETKEGKIVIEVEEVPQEVKTKIAEYVQASKVAFDFNQLCKIGEYGYQLAKEIPDEVVERWVKASEVEIKPRQKYFAKWPSGTGIKSTGWFQESDGTFFWCEQGYIPVLKKERNQLLILQPIQLKDLLAK